MQETITCYDGTKVRLNDKWYKKVNAICNNVLKEITPKEEDIVRMMANVSKIVRVIKEGLGDDVNCALGGSLGKGTNLR